MFLDPSTLNKHFINREKSVSYGSRKRRLSTERRDKSRSASPSGAKSDPEVSTPDDKLVDYSNDIEEESDGPTEPAWVRSAPADPYFAKQVRQHIFI